MGSAYHQLFFHFVWGTYQRLDMIDERTEKVLRKLIKDKVIEKLSELLCFGSTTDHIHLLVRMHPSISVSELIGEIKGYSSYIITNRMGVDYGLRWQGGYGALTVSQKEIPWLIQYINHQKEHHCFDDISKKWELLD